MHLDKGPGWLWDAWHVQTSNNAPRNPQCRPGTYADVTGLSACKSCPTEAGFGAETCTLCAAGEFAGAQKPAAAAGCLVLLLLLLLPACCSHSFCCSYFCCLSWPVTYAADAASRSCAECPNGKISVAGAIGASQCTKCPAGERTTVPVALASCLRVYVHWMLACLYCACRHG